MLHDVNTSYDELRRMWNHMCDTASSEQKHKFDDELKKLFVCDVGSGMLTPAAACLIRDRWGSRLYGTTRAVAHAKFSPHVGVFAAFVRFATNSLSLVTSAFVKQAEKKLDWIVEHGYMDCAKLMLLRRDQLRIVLRAIRRHPNPHPSIVSEHVTTALSVSRSSNIDVYLEEGFDTVVCSNRRVLASWLVCATEPRVVNRLLLWLLGGMHVCRPLLLKMGLDKTLPTCVITSNVVERVHRPLLQQAYADECTLLQDVDAWLREDAAAASIHKLEDEEQPSLVSLIVRNVLLQHTMLIERSSMQTFDWLINEAFSLRCFFRKYVLSISIHE